MLFVDPWELTEDQALRKYQKIARKLNDRIRTLEKHGVATSAMEKYQTLVEDLTDGRKRLPQALSPSDARSALLRVQDLIQDRGTKWAAVKSTASKGINTYREKYGIEFDSIQQYTKFMSSDAIRELRNLYGSDSVLAVASEVADNKNREAAEKFLEGDQNTAADLLSLLGFETQADLLRAAAKVRR